jgi:hypothetical protein
MYRTRTTMEIAVDRHYPKRAAGRLGQPLVGQRQSEIDAWGGLDGARELLNG